MVETSTQRAKNVAAVKLGHGQQIERSGEKSDPSGAANRVEQERTSGNARMQNGGEETQEKWRAEGQVDLL